MAETSEVDEWSDEEDDFFSEPEPINQATTGKQQITIYIAPTLKNLHPTEIKDEKGQINKGPKLFLLVAPRDIISCHKPDRRLGNGNEFKSCTCIGCFCPE